MVGGTVISGALVFTLAEYERKDLALQIRSRHAAERVQQLILSLEAVPKDSRGSIIAINEHSGIHTDLTNSSTIIGTPTSSDFSEALKHILGDDRTISAFERWGADCPIRHPEEFPPNEIKHCQTVFTSLKDGTPIRLDIAFRDLPPPPFRGPFPFNVLAFLLIISILALIVAHIATKPLRRLAQAARDLGRNIEHHPLPTKHGSREVREASIAFNSMQTSIRNHIQERTYMLAAIAHDLQTPLTRLRLRLEKVKDTELRSMLISDLAATQNMVKEGLDFAQTMNKEEPFESIDLDSLVEAICNDAIDAGCQVTHKGRIGRTIMASPGALRRCISNLVDNAVKYGKYAEIHVRQEKSMVIISIVDGGSGIPKDQLESVFEPFKRIEDSRSRSTGGTGLGLTIARIIAGRHRGTIKLENKDNGQSGLIATLELPIS